MNAKDVFDMTDDDFKRYVHSTILSPREWLDLLVDTVYSEHRSKLTTLLEYYDYGTLALDKNIISGLKQSVCQLSGLWQDYVEERLRGIFPECDVERIFEDDWVDMDESD